MKISLSGVTLVVSDGLVVDLRTEDGHQHITVSAPEVVSPPARPLLALVAGSASYAPQEAGPALVTAAHIEELREELSRIVTPPDLRWRADTRNLSDKQRLVAQVYMVMRRGGWLPFSVIASRMGIGRDDMATRQELNTVLSRLRKEGHLCNRRRGDGPDRTTLDYALPAWGAALPSEPAQEQ